MNVLIVGSGLIGVTTAYYLSRRGYSVLVVDRDQGPALGASFANGGLLTPGMSEPWNAPGCWRLLVSSLGRSDAALQVRMMAVPALARWGYMFLRNSAKDVFERSTLANLRMSVHSLRIMDQLREQTGIKYDRQAKGSLKIFRDRAALDRSWTLAEAFAAEGQVCRKLSAQETVDLEPFLAPLGTSLSGAIHYERDEAGDAHRFCCALTEVSRRQGVQFRYEAEVSSLEVSDGRINAVICNSERLIADRYVIAAGSYSPRLLRSAGVHIPVSPVKGYSITLDTQAAGPSPGIPVIDDHWHAAITALGSRIRVAGTAEFAGYDRSIEPARIQNLLKLLRRLLPAHDLDAAKAHPWCGLRAMSADGVPLIGKTRIRNLFVNTGHGHLGWTMAAASGEMLADVLSVQPTAIDSEPFAPGRFK